jgi:NAD(P)-dependent dehydrogenase (short-subunit alcohol dehydrogenase family)
MNRFVRIVPAVPNGDQSLAGRRVFITGAARGIGAALAQRLHSRGARPAIAGLEPDLLAAVAASCGDAPWWTCDVTDRDRVAEVVDDAARQLGGLDVVVANAGVAAQMPIIGGDVKVWDATISVNLGGAFNTVRAAGPHVSHGSGYALMISSLAAAVHPPLLGPYCASKAAVEALGDVLRVELRPTGARVGVAYFAELDTEMTSRGFGTAAAEYLTRHQPRGVAPLSTAIDALERGIARRSRQIVTPRWVAAALPARAVVQRVVELAIRPRVAETLRLAEEEHPELTTPQPQ